MEMESENFNQAVQRLFDNLNDFTPRPHEEIITPNMYCFMYGCDMKEFNRRFKAGTLNNYDRIY